VKPEGRLNRSGQMLDAFLERFGYTIDPHADGRRYAHHTDIVNWFAGERGEGRGDITPADEDVELCWGWVEREIELVSPRVIVALGLPAARELLSRTAALGPDGAAPQLDELLGVEHRCVVGGRSLPALVVHHPAIAFQYPNSGAVYRATAERIARVLEDG
jgi:uracil-DNA glycosylase family 4